MAAHESIPIPPGVKDCTGQRFGRLLVLKFAGFHHFPRGQNAARWECLCDCGNISIVERTLLVTGKSKSCGCLRTQLLRTRHATHGMTETTAYRLWSDMKTRCENPHYKRFSDYGGRGITVCEAWRNSFEQFFQDMGERHSPFHSIERIDNDGPYSPENCRWATRKEQGRNKRNNRRFQFQNKSLTLPEWAEEVDILYRTLLSRFQKGWSVEEMLTRPVRKRKE